MDQVQHLRKPFSPVKILRLFREAFTKLLHNDPLRMAGATAFFTSFALPFILIILLQILGLVFNPATVRKQIFQDLSGVFGSQSVRQIINTLVAFRHLAHNLFITVLGVVFLLMVSTTLLMVIKSSINQLWRIRLQGKRHFFVSLLRRLQSILIIAATAILFLVSIVAEGAKVHLARSLRDWSPVVASYFMGLLTYLLSVIITTLWFAFFFRILPDGRPSWKVALTGAFVTSVLFNLGKYLLRLLLNSSNLNSLYGTSANVVLILLFVFYCSLIMYFGAAFTRVWAEYCGLPIEPRSYAVRYKLTEIAEP